MRRLDKNVEYVVDESQSVVKMWAGGEIDLLFIDALHDYDNVKADFEAWVKYLSDGGYVLFHDSVQSGVNRFLQELLECRRDLEPFGLRDSLFVFKKSRQKDENKNRFFARYLKNKGDDFEHWMQRDKKNIIIYYSKSLGITTFTAVSLRGMIHLVLIFVFD
jgi:predicted O-methyltransferase YrrM